MPMMYIKSSNWSGFEIKNWIENQFQSSPKLVGIWTVLRCIFAPNLEIITSIGGELWHGQAQNGVNFDFGVQFDLGGHNQSSRKAIGILTKVFYIFGPNLMILAETVDELSHGQAHDWRTHTHTYTHTQATTISKKITSCLKMAWNLNAYSHFSMTNQQMNGYIYHSLLLSWWNYARSWQNAWSAFVADACDEWVVSEEYPRWQKWGQWADHHHLLPWNEFPPVLRNNIKWH